ncbi:DNA internalization-related competence protein ComEC/Rec2 [Natroniella sulfidigena]|uniref:DNA internalization-related competence protein ComEC/Rec2 n=1 Tax=Natroniella sulfidigena TaxID=723921 RepID=UPI00200A33F3|nr:DNA internalization-related competence protein ComEC/Rec2 [Natroniella sulfidigena]MCK8815904.1 DNA internalization-related competence protein ComEC/Rec2 [Natroniella sulfidigena]
MVFAYYFGVSAELLLVSQILAALLFAFFIRFFYQQSDKLMIISWLLIFLVGLIYLGNVELAWQDEPLGEVVGERVEIEGRIIEVEETSQGLRYLLSDLEVAEFDLTSQQKVLLFDWTDDQQQLNYGDLVKVNTELELAPRKRNPGGFSYRDYLKRNGIYALGHINSSSQINQVGVSSNLILDQIFNLRLKIIESLDSYFSTPNNYILQALLLGNQSLLPPEVEDGFREVGLSHLLVISGFHIGLLSYIIYFICQKLKLSEKVTLILNFIILSSYLLLTGWQLPALRAVILISLVLWGRYQNRKVDIYNLLAGVALVILAINPWSIFTVSFQLSFGAVIAISSLTPLISVKFPFIPQVNNLLAASIAAQVGLLPVLAYYFNQVSVISILANLLLTPLITVVLWLSILFLAVVAVWSSGGIIVANIIEGLLNLSQLLVGLLVDNFWTTVSIGRPDLITIVIYYLLLYYLVKFLKSSSLSISQFGNKRKLIVTLSLMLVLIFQFGFDNHQDLKIIFFDVGQGDAIYLRLPTGQKVLVDAGEEGTEIKRYLKSRGIRSLDLILISHFHWDHAGGVKPLIQNFSIGQVFYPPNTKKKELEIKVREKLERKKIEHAQLVAGNEISLLPLEIEVLGPTFPLLEESAANNNSLVLKAIYDQFNLLLTGDIEKEAERRLVKRGIDLESIVLKVAHHGSISSSIEEFIEQVNPELAVIQVGDNNYGHPDPTVIDRFEERGIKVLRNDRDGAVIVKADGEQYSYQTFLD